MNALRIPETLLQSATRPFLRTGDIVIVRYCERQEAEKIHIEASHNLITLLVNGRKDVFGADGKVSIGEGEGFFLRRGNYLMNERFFRDQYYESLLIFFTDRVAHELTADLSADSGNGRAEKDLVRITAAPPIDTFVASIRLLFGQNTSDNLLGVLLPLKLKELFILLNETQRDSSFVSFLHNLRVQPSLELRRLIEQHFRENLTLDQYAFLSGHSLSSFKRLFRSTFGEVTPGHWIQERRLKEAALLLNTSHLNVSEIGFDVGFENSSHFVQAFKKHFRCTPSQFRKPEPELLTT